MTEILVTGGTGALGSQLVPRLLSSGYGVRVLSRRADPVLPAGARAVRGDLLTRDGVADSVAGADVVVHCATGAADGGLRGTMYKPTVRSDVVPTKALLDIAKRAGIQRFVYISIVGIDQIPLGYYRGKLDCERAIESSGIPFTILRTTQWHTLAWEFCIRFTGLPVVMIPKGLRTQLLDPGEVAERMVSLIEARTEGHAPDMGGPAVLNFPDIVRSYLKATGKRRVVVQVPLPGKALRRFREGLNLTPAHADGKRTWQDWLSARVAATT
jgi:uncharacterized protein YbjT (DUF2867 family)